MIYNFILTQAKISFSSSFSSLLVLPFTLIFLFALLLLSVREALCVSGMSALGVSQASSTVMPERENVGITLMLTLRLVLDLSHKESEDSSMIFTAHIFVDNRADMEWLGSHGQSAEVTTWALKWRWFTHQVLKVTVLGGWLEATKHPLDLRC